MLGWLLLLVPSLWLVGFLFRRRGTRRRGGYLPRSAYTGTKVLGRRTPATATTAASSSFSGRGPVSAVPRVLTLQPHASSCTGHGSFIDVTETRGTSGAPPERAV